jgi:hypothetical protein
MDPISCFALAGTIVQFVDFTAKLISVGHELYKAGELSVQEKAALATNDLLDLSLKLERPLRSGSELTCLTEDEVALGDLCHTCHEMAAELIERLDKLKVHDRHDLSKSLRKAFRNVWERTDLKDMEERLTKFRAAIDTRILISLRYEITLGYLPQSHPQANPPHENVSSQFRFNNRSSLIPWIGTRNK